jgi:hypothetical protein
MSMYGILSSSSSFLPAIRRLPLRSVPWISDWSYMATKNRHRPSVIVSSQYVRSLFVDTVQSRFISAVYGLLPEGKVKDETVLDQPRSRPPHSIRFDSRKCTFTHSSTTSPLPSRPPPFLDSPHYLPNTTSLFILPASLPRPRLKTTPRLQFQLLDGPIPFFPSVRVPQLSLDFREDAESTYDIRR